MAGDDEKLSDPFVILKHLLACRISPLGHNQTLEQASEVSAFTHESGHAPNHAEMSAKCQKRTLSMGSATPTPVKSTESDAIAVSLATNLRHSRAN